MGGKGKTPEPGKAAIDGDASRTRVLVVPGWGAPFFQTEWIAGRLRRAGLEVSGVRLPRLAIGDLDISAESLAGQVERAAGSSPDGKFSFLGYSLGGLIVRVYLQKFGGRTRLDRAVFLGAPQDGIYSGYPASFTKGGRQVRRGSSYMRKLNKGACPGCDSPSCLSIYLARDGIIVPSESARLRCGYNLELAWPVFHWGLVFNPGIIAVAAEFMKGRLPEGATAGCRDEESALPAEGI